MGGVKRELSTVRGERGWVISFFSFCSFPAVSDSIINGISRRIFLAPEALTQMDLIRTDLWSKLSRLFEQVFLNDSKPFLSSF